MYTYKNIYFINSFIRSINLFIYNQYYCVRRSTTNMANLMFSGDNKFRPFSKTSIHLTDAAKEIIYYGDAKRICDCCLHVVLECRLHRCSVNLSHYYWNGWVLQVVELLMMLSK